MTLEVGKASLVMTGQRSRDGLRLDDKRNTEMSLKCYLEEALNNFGLSLKKDSMSSKLRKELAAINSLCIANFPRLLSGIEVVFKGKWPIRFDWTYGFPLSAL